MTPPRLVLLVTVLLYLVFHVWYGGEGDPLAADETERRLAAIADQGDPASGHEGDLVASFRELARHDDGRAFYMLNLMRYREKALYPPGSPWDDDVEAAASRYNAAVLPALLARGSHPILLGRYAGAFIPPDLGETRWDQIGIVRYRSRRDMLDMAEALAASGGGIHKWASIEETIVFPVEPILDLVFVRGLVFVLLAIPGAALAWALRRRAP